MKNKAKKFIYVLSSLVLAVVIFLSGILFIRSNFISTITHSPTQGGNTDLGSGTNGNGGNGPTDGIGSGSGSGGLGSGSGLGSSGGSNDGSGGSGTGTDGDGLGEGPGSGGGGGGEGGEPVENYLFRIYSEKTQTVYLSEDVYGDYVGKGYNGFNKGYTYEHGVGEIDASEYFANVLKESGVAQHFVDLELKADLSRLYPYYYNKIYESDAGMMQYRARTYHYIYDAQTFGDLSSFSSLSSAYSSQEDKYAQFVKQKYLVISNKLKNTLRELAQENGLDAKSQTIISDVASYIQNAAYYDISYANKSYPDDKDMVTYFLIEHKRGVCRHFAAAATMMYRALGIPARYVTGYKVDVTAGEWLIYGDEPEEQGHAWVEVYLEDYGWVAIEVTGGNMGDGPENDPEEDSDGEQDGQSQKDVVYVKTGDLTKVYDGLPLTAKIDITGLLIEGHVIKIKYTPSLTEVGSVSSKPIIKIYDENGKDCTSKANIIYDCGTLTVTPRTITLTTGSKTASGFTSLQCKEYEVEGLAAGDYVVFSGLQYVTLNGYGVCSNTIQYSSLIIKNAKGEDVTKNYEISICYGVLVLMP